MAAAQLAAVGTAGAWRLGRWDLLKQYLHDVTASADSLSADELWELRIGKLLLSVSNRHTFLLLVPSIAFHLTALSLIT